MFYINVEMFAVSRSCWVTGGSVTRCASKNVQEIYWLWTLSSALGELG